MARHASRERLRWSLAALSLAINLLLSVMHVGLMDQQLSGRTTLTATSAASTSAEGSLLNALAVICTEHGLAKRGAQKGGDKSGIFPTCPLCFLFASMTLILAFGQLVLVLCRTRIGRIPPPVIIRNVAAFFERPAQPRAPPSFSFAI